MSPSGGVSFEDIEDVPDGVTTDIDYGSGFAGSAFGGVKLNKNLGAELEFLFATGNGDSDDFNDGFADIFNSAGDTPGINVSGAFTVDKEQKESYLSASK